MTSASPPQARPSLLEALRARGALLPGEEHLLASSEVRALAPRAQLAHLAANRRVGRVITALNGGVRLALLAGGLVALAALVLDREDALAWWMPIVWLAAAGLLLRLITSWVAQLRELGTPLPDAESLGIGEDEP